MCGRIIQSSAPIQHGIVDGMNVRVAASTTTRRAGTPSQDLLVIRRNHKTGEVSLDPLRWGLIPYWCEDPKGEADQRQMRDRQDPTFVPGRLSNATVHPAG
jgi:putative SOS response-associated peptidase YedK